MLKAACNHPFAAVAGLYTVFIVGVWYFGWPADRPARDYVAASRLVHNHRVLPADLRRPGSFAQSLGFYMAPTASIEGKYIRTSQPIMAGQPVPGTALADKPDMQMPDNKVRPILFPLPANAGGIALLDAGSPVLLLGQDPASKAPVTIQATVHAILCEPAAKAGQNCNPILRVPADQSLFVSKNESALRLVPGSDLNP